MDSDSIQIQWGPWIRIQEGKNYRCRRNDSSLTVLRIRDVYPASRIRFFSIPYPKYLNPKIVSKSRKYDPGCSSRIPDLGVKKAPDPIPRSGSATLIFKCLLFSVSLQPFNTGTEFFYDDYRQGKVSFFVIHFAGFGMFIWETDYLSSDHIGYSPIHFAVDHSKLFQACELNKYYRMLQMCLIKS